VRSEWDAIINNWWEYKKKRCFDLLRINYFNIKNQDLIMKKTTDAQDLPEHNGCVCPFEFYADEPTIVSPNLGCPKFFMISECEDTAHTEYIFYINLICRKGTKAEDLTDTLQVDAIPLFEMDPQSKRLRRGDPIPLEILEAMEKNSLMLYDEELLHLYRIEDKRPSYILRHNFFGKNQTIFWIKAKLNFSCDDKASHWLEDHRFLMFDLEQIFPNPKDPTLDSPIKRTCFHAITVFAHDQSTFNFAHITDIHIAKRFDELLGVLSLQIDPVTGPKIMPGTPTITRYHNPNNYFRKFIRWANQLANQGQLDFIIATGDLIDYCLKYNLPKMRSYELHETNWDIFMRIVLNFSLDHTPTLPQIGIEPQEELSIPLFTQTGNHDVRLYGYPITATGIYKHFGLNLLEAQIYKDPYKRRAFRSIQTDKYCLRAYYQFINPFDDFMLRFGNFRGIFLNSGADSFTALKSLLMANPGSVGFSEKQILFLQQTTKMMMEEDPQKTINVLFSHGPILNPVFRNWFYRQVAKFLNKKSAKELNRMRPDWYKEANLQLHKIKNIRADQALDFNFGTISDNRLDAMAIMMKYNMMGIHGHTHMPREFRFVATGEKMTTIKDGEIVGDPFAVFWDDYSFRFTWKDLIRNLPLDIQTPSLGIQESKEHEPAGAFRLFIIRDGKLKEWQTKHINYFSGH
jgi:hypothetical protein